MSSAVESFHPVVRAWFKERFSDPSRAQELGWPAIAQAAIDPRRDVLLCAPTGSGKTLAAFMWAIDRLVRQSAEGHLKEEVSVLYVSPLKALANDIRRNLDEPLGGVKKFARLSGLDLSAIRAGLRTGDTPTGERNATLRHPPNILVTTPESLFILLTSPRFRRCLSAVSEVIVDELHALAGNKRGAHLSITLERLERMVRRNGHPRPTRIGLSATLNPIETLARFLAGSEPGEGSASRPRPVRIVRAAAGARHMDLRVIASGPQLGPLATHEHWEAMYDRLAKLLQEHRTTVVFTLSRRWAERVALNLQKRVGAGAVMAHHGSLARSERLLAEQRLKQGELKAIVATASLELGIDIGAVELVCQIDSPRSLSAAIQRVGRSGHRLEATPKGRFFAMTLDDLLECGAAVRAIRRGRLDEVEIPRGCLDVAAQQIAAIAAEEEEITEEELLAILRRAYTFSNLPRDSLSRLLDQMALEPPQRIQGVRPRIFFDRVNRRIRPRRGARLAAITSGGTIPASGNYDVVIESEGRKVGDVEEDFAQESARGDVFALGSMPWQIQRISHGRLMVEAAPGMAPTLPFWQTEAAGRSVALSAEVSDLRREIAARLGDPDGAAAWIASECAMDRTAAAQAVDYVRRGAAALGVVPDEKTIVIERFFDGLGGTQVVFHSPGGIRLNRGLGLALRKRLCQSFDFEIQASAIDDGVLLALNTRHSFPLEHLFSMVGSKNVGGVLVQALLNAPMFELRFRHVATRALGVMRSAAGNRVPVWIQRLRSQELLAALFPGQQACFENRPPIVEVPGHFLVEETVRECLEESTDLPAIVRLLEGIEAGSTRVVTVDSVSPSAFAQRLLLAWDYSFLDDGERANRRSRTVAMNRNLAEDVLRTGELRQLFSPDVVEQVVAEASGRTHNRRPRDHDELYELIRKHGAMDAGAIKERVGEGWGAMVARLEGENRILRSSLGPGGTDQRYIAAEDAALFASAYRSGADGPEADERDPGIDSESARQEILARTLKTSAPIAAPGLAAKVGFSASQVEQTLHGLEARGAVFRGRFTSAAEEQWCDRHVLERIHRITLARARGEIEPCTDDEFSAFRLLWMHIGGQGIHDDSEGLATVLTQLSGLSFSPVLWEKAILPARISAYRPEMLDRCCLGGRTFWVGESSGEAVADIPSRVRLLPRGRFQFPTPAPNAPNEPKQARVYQALADGGAQYLDQVAERADLSERDTMRALWRLAADGLASNDNFAPLRLFADGSAALRAIGGSTGARGGRRRQARLRARLRSSLAGRWSLVERGQRAPEGYDDTRALATLLLERNGILSREMLKLESTPIAWHGLSAVLRRMEYAGIVRRGWFVRALSADQYALPEAVSMLREIRSGGLSAAHPCALSAIDPANPYGALLAGCGISREAGNLVVIAQGRVIMGLSGRTLMVTDTLDAASFRAAMSALLKLGGRVALETIGETPALRSPWTGELAAMSFHSDGRALIHDGLPGPRPAGAPLPAARLSQRA